MKRAFTLIELVVVLVVIAALTHLAVRELSHLRDAKLAKVADAQLEAIRDGVYGKTPEGDSAGFLSDMGRLPRLADGKTLGELWTMPTNALPYAVRPATAENLVPGLSALANASVYVPTGWRGPYLRLPFGKSRLLDPWGNPVEKEDSAGLPRLSTNSNGFIVAVSHYGPQAQMDAMSTLSLLPVPSLPGGGATSRIVVTTASANGASVAWYGPAGGLITGAVHAVSAAAPFTFEGLTPGMRVLYYNGAAHVVAVKPGDNLISIDLP